MTPSYISTNIEELFDSAMPDIQKMITGNDVNESTALLGKIHKIPVSSYVALSNIITFILIGALKPEDAVKGIKDILNLGDDEAYKLAEDLEKTILEKARINILGKSRNGVVNMTMSETRTPEELRKEIMDTTKRDFGIVKNQTVNVSTAFAEKRGRKEMLLAPGSRPQLLEQFQILDSIPNDEEIEERLSHIRGQMKSIEDKSASRNLETRVPLKNFMFGEKGKEPVIEIEPRSANYSKSPTKYNVDPYREVMG